MVERKERLLRSRVLVKPIGELIRMK